MTTATSSPNSNSGKSSGGNNNNNNNNGGYNRTDNGTVVNGKEIPNEIDNSNHQNPLDVVVGGGDHGKCSTSCPSPSMDGTSTPINLLPTISASGIVMATTDASGTTVINTMSSVTSKVTLTTARGASTRSSSTATGSGDSPVQVVKLSSSGCGRSSDPGNGVGVSGGSILSHLYGLRSVSSPSVLLVGETNATRTMQNDEEFNIRFVNLVRKYKCLYDRKVPEYRNRDNQEKAWLNISIETKESVVHCKERWRNLRACLSRYIKQQSGSEPQHKPYYLTEHMAFLLPFLKSCRNDTTLALASLYQQQQQQHSVSGHHQSQSPTHQQQQPQQQRTTLSVLKEPTEINNNSMNNQNNRSLQHNQSNILNSLGLTNIMQTPPFHYNNMNQQEASLIDGGAGFTDQTVGHMQMNQQLPYINAVKCSMSEQDQDEDDEETMDAFDSSLQALDVEEGHHHNHNSSPNNVLSDTASASSLQNFIPDVQLSELHGPEEIVNVNTNERVDGIGGQRTHQSQRSQPSPTSSIRVAFQSDMSQSLHKPKRIKTETQLSEQQQQNISSSWYPGERADMEFLRSILPDMAGLTPQQKRKFKIGILELIDDIIERYPIERGSTSITTSPSSHSIANRNRRRNRFNSVNRE